MSPSIDGSQCARAVTGYVTFSVTSTCACCLGSLALAFICELSELRNVRGLRSLPVPSTWLCACCARLCPVLRWRRRRQTFFVCAGQPGRQMLASSAAAAAAAAAGKAAAAAAAAASSTGKSLPVHACAFTFSTSSTVCSHSRQAVLYVCKLTLDR